MAKKQPSIDEILSAARKSDGQGNSPRQQPQNFRDGQWEVEVTERCDHYSLELEDSEEDAVKGAFVELWKKLAEGVPQKYQDAEWSVIYVELWYDSGRVIVYPNAQPPSDGRYAHDRDERACFTVCAPLIEELFIEFTDREEESSDFDSAAALQQRILPWIAGGIQDSLDTLRRQKQFTIYWFEYNAEDGIHELVVN